MPTALCRTWNLPLSGGILLRLFSDVFDRARELQDNGSEMQVCNGELRDLLMPLGHPVTMPEVCVHPVLIVYVKNSTVDVADTFSNSLSLIVHANTKKTVAATAMISKGSREGHRVKLRMEKRDTTDNTIVASEVIFVDLAAHVCQQAAHVVRGLHPEPERHVNEADDVQQESAAASRTPEASTDARQSGFGLTSQKLSMHGDGGSLIISIVETTEPCSRPDPLLLNQPAVRYQLWLLFLFFLCKPHVTRIQWTLDKNHKTVMILCLLDRY